MLELWRSVCKNKSRPNPTTIHQNRQTGILIDFFTIELKYNFSFSPSLKSSGKGGEREEEGGREGREDRNFFTQRQCSLGSKNQSFLRLLCRILQLIFNSLLVQIFFIQMRKILSSCDTVCQWKLRRQWLQFYWCCYQQLSLERRSVVL